MPFAPLTSGHRYCPFVPTPDRNCAEMFQVKKTVDCTDSEGAFLNCRSGGNSFCHVYRVGLVWESNEVMGTNGFGDAKLLHGYFPIGGKAFPS